MTAKEIPVPNGKSEEKQNEEKTETMEDEGKAGPVREAMPQILASSAKNMLLLGIGMTLGFPTVVIGALHMYTNSSGQVRNVTDPNGLFFNDHQAAWFGSLMMICQPLGSLLSGSLLEPLGRKRGMLAVNIPHLTGWIMYATANSIAALMVASAIMGLSMGFMEAPIITYVGEISTPKLRGALTSMAGISVMLGFFVEYLLGSILPWRTVASVSACVPVLTLVAISMVPESPVWLVSRGRIRDAEKSLQWLRGWVDASAVKTELSMLVSHNKKMRTKVGTGNVEAVMQLSDLEASQQKSMVLKESNGVNNAFEPDNDVSINNDRDVSEEKKNGTCNGGFEPDAKEADAKEMDAKEQFRENMRVCHERLKPVKSVLPEPRPVSEISEVKTATTNVKVRSLTLLQAFKALAKQSTLKPLMLVISFFVIHHWTGLSGIRPYMVSVFEDYGLPVDAHWVTVLSAVLGMGGNIFCMMTVAWLGKRPLALASIGGVGFCCILLGSYMCLLQAGSITTSTWIPLTLFIFFFSFHSFGIGPIPWMLLSEVFPYEGRGMATGIAAAVSYVLGFFATESFLDLKRLLGLGGIFLLYGSVALVGVVYMGLYMPETEGHSLHDIEAMYSKKNKSKNRIDVSKSSNRTIPEKSMADVTKTAL